MHVLLHDLSEVFSNIGVLSNARSAVENRAPFVKSGSGLVKLNKISGAFAVGLVKRDSNSLGEVHTSGRRVSNLTDLDHEKFQIA